MTDPKIPPRPWRADCSADGEFPAWIRLVDAGGEEFFACDATDSVWGTEVFARMSALVNAEPEIVAALEAAEKVLGSLLSPSPEPVSLLHADLALIRTALAKVRP